MNCLKRRSKYRQLLKCRRFIAEVYRWGYDDGAIVQVIANLPNVRKVEYEHGGFRPAIVRVFFDGNRIFESDFHGYMALRKAAFEVYILWYKKITSV